MESVKLCYMHKLNWPNETSIKIVLNRYKISSINSTEPPLQWLTRAEINRNIEMLQVDRKKIFALLCGGRFKKKTYFAEKVEKDLKKNP